MLSRTTVVLLVAALSLPACSLRGQVTSRGPDVTAGQMLRDDSVRQGWTAFRIVREEVDGAASFAMSAYLDRMTFDVPGVEEPAECWAFAEAQRGEGGVSGGGGGCTKVGEPYPAGGDWSWTGDEPDRILGTAPDNAEMMEVVYADGTTELIEPFVPGPPFTRRLLGHRLSRPVADVVEVRPVQQGRTTDGTAS